MSGSMASSSQSPSVTNLVTPDTDVTICSRGSKWIVNNHNNVTYNVRTYLMSLLTVRLNTTAGPVTLVSEYALTMSATSNTKDEFYENLTATISSVPNNEQLVSWASSMPEWVQKNCRSRHVALLPWTVLCG